MWTFLSIITIISLIVFWKGPNAVWGGFSLGAMGGLAMAIVSFSVSKEFQWSMVGKGVIVGVVLGLGAELFGKLSAQMKKK